MIQIGENPIKLAERNGFELSYMDPAPVASRSIDQGEAGCIRIYGLCEELCDLLRAMMESARLVLIGTTASRAREFARFAKRRSDRLPITDKTTQQP